MQGRRNLLGIRRVCFRGYIGSKLNLRCCQDDSKPEQKENPLRGNVLSAAVKAVREEFAVEIAERPDQRREAYQLRHQVYCMERHFEPPQGGIESDGFDHRAHHAVLRRRGGGRVVGTVRVVPVSAEDPVPQPSDAAGVRRLSGTHTAGRRGRNIPLFHRQRGAAGGPAAPAAAGPFPRRYGDH